MLELCGVSVAFFVWGYAFDGGAAVKSIASTLVASATFLLLSALPAMCPEVARDPVNGAHWKPRQVMTVALAVLCLLNSVALAVGACGIFLSQMQSLRLQAVLDRLLKQIDMLSTATVQNLK